MRRRLLNNNSGHQYGTGTLSDPFLIYDVNDLCLCRNLNNTNSIGSYHGTHTSINFESQYLKLKNDIDLSEVCGEGIGNWEGFKNFKGNFDGDKHIISNMYHKAAAISSVANALFHTITGTIRNIIIDNAYSYGWYSSGLCSQAGQNSFIENCIVRNTRIAAYQSCSPLVGQLNGGTITNCICEASCKLIDTQIYTPQTCFGGIVGRLLSGTVSFCINLMDIETNKGCQHIGGVVGSGLKGGANISTQYVIGNINFGKIKSVAISTGCIEGVSTQGTLLANLNCGLFNSRNYGSGILGYRETNTSYVRGNLNIGIIKPYDGLTNVSPIAKYGTPTTNYNYHTPEVSDAIENTAGKIIQISQFNLICPDDNSKPSAITDSTYWNTMNWVFKRNLYPYPAGISNLDACHCAAAPIVFTNGNTYKTITAPVQLWGADYGVTWQSSNPSIMEISNTITGGAYYIATPLKSGTVTLTNYKNGKAYKRIQLTIPYVEP